MRVTVPSFAKINLDLRVLDRRTDNFHELRTVFQTISLKDTLAIDLQISKRTTLQLDSSVDIADNLVLRAANSILTALRIRAAVKFKLVKRIPMGAGLGGGSSNAAAVLLAIPALVERPMPVAQLVRFAEELGSDVPFFLLGGTAIGLGRGTELYPLPDLANHHGVVVSTGVHVSSAAAYRSLNRDVTNALTSSATSPILREFQAVAWALGNSPLGTLPFRNDFEDAVFKMHPELAVGIRKLRRLGAKPALMTGSGSALFGLFSSAAKAHTAVSQFPAGHANPFTFISRKQYRKYWDFSHE